MGQQHLRHIHLSRLKQLSNQKEEKKNQEDVILKQLFESFMWQKAQVISIYSSLAFEFNTLPIMERAMSEGKQIVLPKVESQEEIRFFYYELGQALQESSFGIPEPIEGELCLADEIDLMIVPGVVFDGQGHRIGYGGGYYDRYLSHYSGDTVSLVFEEQLTDVIIPNEYDQKVQHIITTKRSGNIE